MIIHDEMDVEVARHGGLDLVEVLAGLDGTVAPIAFTDDPSGRNVEGSDRDVVPCRV